MKKLLLVFLCLSSITCFSQKKDKRDGAYSAHLYSVEVSKKDLKVGTIDTLHSIYQDSIMKIVWSYDYSQIGFELTNESEQTLKLIWDDAAYISIKNESGRIFHKGVKYIDRENPQPPTAVYKKTTLSDLISPTSYTYYASSVGWISNPLIPDNASIWTSKIEFNQDLIGQTMRVILPIKIEDKVI